MTKMLWTADYSQFWEEQFSKIVEVKRAGFNVHARINDYLSQEDLISELKGCDIFFVAYDKITEYVLKNSPDLKLILSVRDGPEENIDLKAAKELGIPVLNSAGRCTISVAEFTFNLMMNMARPVITLNRTIREQGWTKDNQQDLRQVAVHNSTELYGKTLGIVGFGRNGRQLAKYANAFNMKVLAFDPFLKQSDVASENVTLVKLNELATRSDYISILARATSENKNMFGKEQFSLMKPNAAFINTGRASLIDNESLKEVLSANKIRMAAIDVFPTESLPLSDSYFDIPQDKLILTNHTAGFSRERETHQYSIGMDNLVKFLEGTSIQNNCTRGVEESPEYSNRGAKLFGKGRIVK